MSTPLLARISRSGATYGCMIAWAGLPAEHMVIYKAGDCQGCNRKRSSTIWPSEAAALQSQGINQPVRLLLIGGAYTMLLANAPRNNDDIDMFWLEEGEDFQKARLALRDGVQTIASKYALPLHWFNSLTHMLISDKMIMPRGK